MFILRKIYSILIDLVETIVIAGAIFVVVYAFLFRPYQVNGQSMYPTYEHGEYILTNLIVLRFEPLRRGDVVVFKAPPPDEEKDFIKRVIGLAGETVMLRDGYIYINGERLDESGYLSQDVKTYGGSLLRENQQFTVPENHYFLLGDNRAASKDSREIGFIARDKIIGKSSIVYWPLPKFQVIQKVRYIR